METHFTPTHIMPLHLAHFYIDDLAYTREQVTWSKEAYEDVIRTTCSSGLHSFLRPSLNPEQIYVLTLPLPPDAAERKSYLYSNITEYVEALQESPGVGEIVLRDEVVGDERAAHIMGRMVRGFSLVHRTLCEIHPQLGEWCREYDSILPIFLRPEILLFHLPGAFEFDYGGYKIGQILERFPEGSELIR